MVHLETENRSRCGIFHSRGTKYDRAQILLDRGATLPCPHHHRCGCDDCAGK